MMSKRSTFLRLTHFLNKLFIHLVEKILLHTLCLTAHVYVCTVMALQKVFPLSLLHTQSCGVTMEDALDCAVIFCRVWAVTVEMSLRVLASSSARCQDLLGMRVGQFALICQVLSHCLRLWQLGKKIKHGGTIWVSQWLYSNSNTQQARKHNRDVTVFWDVLYLVNFVVLYCYWISVIVLR